MPPARKRSLPLATPHNIGLMQERKENEVEDRLLKIDEVSERFGVTVETVYKWGQDGTLPRVALSRRAIRYRESDVEQFITERLQKA